jgi:hypothetical protein
VTYLDPYTHLQLHEAETDRRLATAVLVRDARLGREPRAASRQIAGPVDAGRRLASTFAHRLSMIVSPLRGGREARA